MTRLPRGMTLIEIMVAGTILAVVLTGAMSLLMTVNQSSERVRRVGDTQEAARLALEQLAADIRSAGMGAQFGSVGVAPASGNVRRVPVIYSGADLVVNDGPVVAGVSATTIATNSIFIISGQPTTGVLSSDGSGMVGTVTGAGVSTTLTIACSNGVGTAVDCTDTSFVTAGDDYRVLVPITGGFQPLIIGDFRNAVYLRPTTVTSLTGTPPVQTMDFVERTANAFSPDPRAPFGFAPGASLQRARVLHYYLWPSADGTYYELKRSSPVLSSNAGNRACDGTDTPFVDETNTANGVKGVVIGSGPIHSLQIRYVTDASASDDPTQFQLSQLGVCSTALMPFLREIRLQVVARSLAADKNITDSAKRATYSTPGFEGTSTANPAAGDAYPRRTFSISVVPRNLQGVRL